MEFSAKVTGDLQIMKSLENITQQLDRKISSRALAAAAKLLVKEIKSRVPVNSGTLRRSIGIKRLKVRGGQVTSIIGPRAGKQFQQRNSPSGRIIKSKDGFYAWFVEHGTKNTPPRPFMRPAFDSNTSKMINIAARIFRQGVEEAAKKGNK